MTSIHWHEVVLHCIVYFVILTYIKLYIMLFDENPSLVSNINALEVPGSNICCCMQSVVFGIEKEVKSL